MAIAEIKELMSNRPDGELEIVAPLHGELLSMVEKDENLITVLGLKGDQVIRSYAETLNVDEAVAVVKALRVICHPRPKTLIVTVDWDKEDSMYSVNLPPKVKLPFMDDNGNIQDKIDVALNALFDCRWEDYTWEVHGKNICDTDNFTVTSVSRDDLRQRGFYSDEVSDEDMESLAKRMENSYLDYDFWEDLDDAAEELGIPKLDEEDE